MAWAGLIASVLMGLSLGLIGGGGSILTVPILLYLFGYSPERATLDSLFVVGTVAAFGALSYLPSGDIRWRQAVSFAVFSILGVFFARAVFLPLLPDPVLRTDTWALAKGQALLLAFACLMLGSSYAMFASAGKKAIPGAPAASEQGRFAIAWRSFLVGNVTGIVGAGGGFLIVPALSLLMGLPMRQAIATSLVIISVNSWFGFVVGAGPREANWSLLLVITGAGIIGSLLGKRLSGFLPERALKKIFALFVLAIALFILVSQLKVLWEAQ